MEPTQDQVQHFRALLHAWGRSHIRAFPWRYIDDPYAVLVAEFMLHRTQTAQALRVYREFLAAYPTLEAFAAADPLDAEAILQPLGLQWRIRGMGNALRALWSAYRAVPTDPGMLGEIRGIGQYISGAVLCFTMDRPVTLVDTNIVRVVGRFFGLDLTGEARRRKSVTVAIGAAVDPDHPRDFYYAVLDLAHLVCHSRREPECGLCPLLPCCVSGKPWAGEQAETRAGPQGCQGPER